MRYAWLLVAVLWVAGCLNYFDRQVLFSLFPMLQRDFGATAEQLGLLSSVFLWTYGLLSPAAGYFADRLGRGRAIVASLIVWSAATWWTGHTTSFGELLGARALMGVSEAFYLPAALALIAETHGATSRSLATGLHQSGLYAGAVGGGWLGAWMAQLYGWRFPFYVLGAGGVLYGVVLWLVLRRGGALKAGPGFHERTGTREPSVSVAALFGLRGFGRLLFAFTTFGVANWLVYTWLPLYLYERFHLTPAEAGFTATFYLQAASFGGVVMGGILADRRAASDPTRARVMVQVLGLVAAAPFLAMLAFAASMPSAIAALILFGLGRGFYDANTMPLLCQLAPGSWRATGYGVLNLSSCVAGGVMTAAAGRLKESLGLDGALAVAAVLLGAAAVVTWTINSRRIASSDSQARRAIG